MPSPTPEAYRDNPDQTRGVAHTPGPWSITDRYPREGTLKVSSPAGLVAYVGNGFNIGTVNGDARLIAAALELLEALKQLHDEDGNAILGMALASAAIAKAEGRS